MNKLTLIAALALSACATTPAFADEVIGDWAIRDVVDPITGDLSYFASTEGAGGQIFITCIKGNASVTILSNEFLGGGAGERRVEYRVDDGAAHDERGWGYGRDLAYPSTKTFIRSIADGERVIIRMFDFRHGSHIVSANISGARAVTDYIYGICGQKNPLAER